MKEPFDIDEAFRRLRLAVAGLPKAAMFDLRDRGYSSPFEQLVGSLISARTRDETTMEVCLRLFARARTPEAMAVARRGDARRPAPRGVVPRAQGPRPDRALEADRRGARRRSARHARGPDRVPGRRPEDRRPDAGRRLRPGGDRRGYPRPPDRQSLGLRRRPRPPRRRRPRSPASSPSATGSRSTSGSSRSASSSAPASGPGARPARCCRCAGRSGSRRIVDRKISWRHQWLCLSRRSALG